MTAQPIGGTPGPASRVNTNSNGSFEFTTLHAGAYIITASRKNFAPTQYGQKDFRSAGLPIILDEASSTFLNIRLPRLGTISGRVVDENDVGMPNHDVVIYRNTRPPQMLSRLRADERGAFRFYGLDPGSYVVRTVAREYEEGSYLPTFAKETTILEDARVTEVNLDQEVNNFDVSPKQGRVYKIEGEVLPGRQPTAVNLTMASDMGREEVQTGKSFRFPPVAPGEYELYAEGPGDGSYNCFMLGGYMPLPVRDRDLTDIQMPVPCVRETQLSVTDKGGQYISPQRVQLLARRKDLAGVGESKSLPIAISRVQLPPGRFELLLKPPPNYCVVGFSYFGARAEITDKGRPDGWNEILAGSGGTLRFTLSSTPGTMHGLVSGLSHEPVEGAPVYLEGYDPDQRKRVTELQVARTDSRGQYQFTTLAPGSYRVLATFEFQYPDAAAMERSGAKVVAVQEGKDTLQDLDLSVIR
ncbi:conserved hypothetical protein [Candidatus Sulfopaludibacter sp. SbA3]|nr:conserved hypothetical protein [Candidatus Sulfopaludibacter sp. SbA3]